MRNSVIIVDIKDNELYAYDEIDINIRNYSDVEKKALLKEFLYLRWIQRRKNKKIINRF